MNTTCTVHNLTLMYCFYVMPSHYSHEVRNSSELSPQPFKCFTFRNKCCAYRCRCCGSVAEPSALWMTSVPFVHHKRSLLCCYHFTFSSVPHDPSQTSRRLSLQEPAQRQWWDNEGTQTVLRSPLNSVTTVH